MKHIKQTLCVAFVTLFITTGFGQHRGANIQNKDFSNKTFTKGDFYGSTASGAKFNHSKLIEANFYGAKLTNTQFVKTNILGATFYGSDLKLARMEGAIGDEANFEGADMHRGQFDNSSFRCARFYGTSLNSASCKNCDFSGANLDRADLRAADLSGSKFTNANITANTLIDSNTKGLPQKHLWGVGYQAGTTCMELIPNYSNGLSSIAYRKMTKFDPAKHGFQFNNQGFRPYLGDGGSISIDFSGFCGGMTYAAGDYFYKNIPTPNQDYTPAPGTELYDYIYSRQSKSIENIAGQVVEYTVNPFGRRDEEFWRWAVNEKLRQLVDNIDAGKPTPILMLRMGKGPADNHWVMAIGYDLGGYRWGLENDLNVNNIKIFIADPNHPRQYMALMPRKESWDLKYGTYDMKNNKFLIEIKDWNCRSFHPNTDFYKSVSTPPRIKNLPNGGSESVNQLVVQFETGGDDLRGGNDNVDILVRYTDNKTELFKNVNKGKRWPSGTISNVVLPLTKKVTSKQISCLKLSTTFGGGIGGDNWNVDMVTITAYKENGDKEELQKFQGKPWKRFTGDKKEEWICTKNTNANVKLN